MPGWKLWVYKALNSWTVVSCWMISVHISVDCLEQFLDWKLVWKMHWIEPCCCDVFCLFVWQSPWNQPDFQRSRFNQRCLSNSPGACLRTQYSTAFIVGVYYWDEMCRDSCLWSKMGLWWWRMQFEVWKNTVDGLPVFEKSMQYSRSMLEH